MCKYLYSPTARRTGQINHGEPGAGGTRLAATLRETSCERVSSTLSRSSLLLTVRPGSDAKRKFRILDATDSFCGQVARSSGHGAGAGRRLRIESGANPNGPGDCHDRRLPLAAIWFVCART